MDYYFVNDAGIGGGSLPTHHSNNIVGTVYSIAELKEMLRRERPWIYVDLNDDDDDDVTAEPETACPPTANPIITPGSTKKRRRVDEVTTLQDLQDILEEITPILTLPNDPSFAHQQDYLRTFVNNGIGYDSSDDVGRDALTWGRLSREVGSFLSYFMVRKTYGEDEEGLRSAAKAMHNLVHHCKGLVPETTNSDGFQGRAIEDADLCDHVLAYSLHRFLMKWFQNYKCYGTLSSGKKERPCTPIYDIQSSPWNLVTPTRKSWMANQWM
jgi:hypothetical protein